LQRTQTNSANEEIIKTFMEFGLSHSESRVFLALAQYGTILVHEVSRISGVSRPESYRVLVDLEKLSLVEKVLCNPTKYRALPMCDAFSLLIARREKNNTALYKKASHFYELFKDRKIRSEMNEVENQFVVIPPGEAMIIKFAKMSAEAQKSICLILPLKKLLLSLNEPFLVKAWERGVAIKVITENPLASRIPKGIINLQKKHSFEIKFIKLFSSLCYGIVDSKEVVITISCRSGYLKSPAIWTNNAGFLELAENYFNVTWEKN
jgi:sugar-specific transcriptional regulator TrmB